MCIIHLPNINAVLGNIQYIIYFKNNTNLMGVVAMIINVYNPML